MTEQSMFTATSNSDSTELLDLGRLDQLNQIGIALSRERDITRLLEAIVVTARAITNADGGTLYRVQDDGTIQFEIMQTDSLGLSLGGTSGIEIPYAPIPLYDDERQPVLSNVVTYAYHRGISLNVADAYTDGRFDFSGTRKFDEQNEYRSRSFLTVPMKNHEDEIIGVLQLLNAVDSVTGNVREFCFEEQQLAESLASQAAIALTNRLLIQRMEAMRP